MLSTFVRIAQLVEAGIYVLLGLALGWGVGGTALAAVALFLLARALFTAGSFALAWIYRTPRARQHRIGPGRTLAMLAREWQLVVAFNLVHVPWERFVLRPDPKPAPGRTPIVLVHGYFANRGYWRALVHRLEAEGFWPVYVPNLRSWHATIERFESELSASLERIAGGCGRRAIVVAHSMGGLGIRAHLALHGTRHVQRVVTLGSPHHGTALGPFGLGANAKQMCRRSAFIAELEAREGQGPGIPALSIYSTHDNMVAPQETSRLAWARNVAVPGRGHIELLHSDEVYALLRAELAAAA
jgi:triacylglycerol esterase/lipase EstA (alpha/beta hydrolase family)